MPKVEQNCPEADKASARPAQKALRARLSRAKLAQLRYQSTAITVAGYETTLDSLAAGMTRRDRLAALQAANRASRLLLTAAGAYVDLVERTY